MRATRELATKACTLVSTSCRESLDELVDALIEDGILTPSARERHPRIKLRRAALRWAQQVTGFKPGRYPNEVAEARGLVAKVVKAALAQWRSELVRNQPQRTEPAFVPPEREAPTETEENLHPRIAERMRRQTPR